MSTTLGAFWRTKALGASTRACVLAHESFECVLVHDSFRCVYTSVHFSARFYDMKTKNKAAGLSTISILKEQNWCKAHLQFEFSTNENENLFRLAPVFHVFLATNIPISVSDTIQSLFFIQFLTHVIIMQPSCQSDERSSVSAHGSVVKTANLLSSVVEARFLKYVKIY